MLWDLTAENDFSEFLSPSETASFGWLFSDRRSPWRATADQLSWIFRQNLMNGGQQLVHREWLGKESADVHALC